MVTIFSLDVALYFSRISNGLTIRLLWLIIPFSRKKVDELFARGAIESFTGVLAFSLINVVVSKCTGGLQPMLNLKQFNCYVHIPTFKILTIGQAW